MKNPFYSPDAILEAFEEQTLLADEMSDFELSHFENDFREETDEMLTLQLEVVDN